METYAFDGQTTVLLMSNMYGWFHLHVGVLILSGLDVELLGDLLLLVLFLLLTLLLGLLLLHVLRC